MKVAFAFFKMAFLSVLAVWTMNACAREDANEEGHTSSLVMSLKNVVPEGEMSKMSKDITQSTGVFRGIEQLYVIPFDTETPQVEPGDGRLGSRNVSLGGTGISRTGLVPNNNSHLFGSALIPNGMNRVLAYGKTPDEGKDASKESKHKYGVLTPEGILNPEGSNDIFFNLEPILTNEELSETDAKVVDILDRLNVVMSLMGKSQYTAIGNIFDQVKRQNSILACSYATFYQLRNEIQSELWRIPYESQELLNEISKIQDAIKAFSDGFAELGTNFPEQYGIPEGTMGFWWNGEMFIRLINGVNISLVEPSSYCYPPNLWYYANSSVKTSINENVRNQYVQGKEWGDILKHYTDGGAVTSFTQAVAIIDKLEYGVGLLELSLDAPGEEAASLINGCPLTGIIIGDQRNLDFRFLPGQGPSQYIFDNTVNGNLSIGETGSSVQMLVLPTETGEYADVHFALEFRNTTGIKRRCQQGDILPWCKFYLAGVLKPSQGVAPQSSSETFDRVFSRDHKTVVTVKVEGLRNAYNTVPDLHSPQLEIGVETEMRWTQITPQSIILDF